MIKSDGSKTVHCYSDEAEAKRLLRALYANVSDADKALPDEVVVAAMDTPDDEGAKGANGLRAVLESIGQIIHNVLSPSVEPMPLVSAIKGRDGETWLLTWTSNSFRDSDGEIFTTKSISDYVERHEQDADKGAVMFWHLKGSEFAKIRWQAVSGRFLVEASVFDKTPIGEAFKEFFAAHPKGHPTIAPMGYGCSHGFYYRKEDRADGVYDWFDKHETSILPWDKAANRHNPQPTMEVIDNMNEHQRAALKEIGGDDLVKLVEETGRQRTKQLEDAGVAYKATEADLSGGLTEGDKATWTTAYVNSLPNSAFLYCEDGADEDKSKRHLPYKNAEGQIDLPHLRNAISRLGQSATGTTSGESWLTEDKRKSLLAKAQRMLAEHNKETIITSEVNSMENEKKEQTGVAPATVLPEPTATVVASNYLTKEEATPAFEALAMQTKALQETLATLTGDLATVAQEVMALKEQLTKAEKARDDLSHSPLASIQAILGMSVVGKKEAIAEPELTRQKPKETKASVTGIDFLDNLINPT